MGFSLKSSRGNSNTPVRFLRVLYVCLLGVLLLQDCSIPLGRAPRVVPVPLLDRNGISLEHLGKLTPGLSDQADFLRLLGEPASRTRGNFPGDTIWLYPIRAWNTRGRTGVVPAALLRIRFDRSGVVQEWHFRDPDTGDVLPVRRTLSRDTRWFHDLAPPPMPPYIDLGRILRIGESTIADIARELEIWQPRVYLGSGYDGDLPVVRKQTTRRGGIWEYYVDRPSPLFIPPHYLIVSFHRSGILRAYWFQTTYPGGKM